MEDSDLTPHATLNIPQLVVLLVIAFLALRWILSGSSSGSTRASASAGSDPHSHLQRGGGQRAGGGGGVGGGGAVASRGAGQRANPRHVETLAQMFPQVPARDIMWDLQRNGNNVQLTSDRILSGRGLETPPPSFQPVIPPSASAAAAASATGAAPPLTQSGPDLIQRYNLGSKIGEDSRGPTGAGLASASTSTSASASGSASPGEAAKLPWSNSKTERQSLLQRRREEMILAARRKMLEKEKSKG